MQRNHSREADPETEGAGCKPIGLCRAPLQGGEADDLNAAEAALRGLVQRSAEPADSRPRRRFRFAGGMNAEPDLAERSGQILRDELGRRA